MARGSYRLVIVGVELAQEGAVMCDCSVTRWRRSVTTWTHRQADAAWSGMVIDYVTFAPVIKTGTNTVLKYFLRDYVMLTLDAQGSGT
jgi:hypothetical protein